MAVYIDDSHNLPVRRSERMKMSRMIADTEEECHAMAAKIGVSRRWWRSPDSDSGTNYDIAMSKRTLALQAGAVAVTVRQLAAMNRRREIEGKLGTPEEISAWYDNWRYNRQAWKAERYLEHYSSRGPLVKDQSLLAKD